VIIMDLMLPTLNGLDCHTAYSPRVSVDSRQLRLSACHSPEHVHRAPQVRAHAVTFSRRPRAPTCFVRLRHSCLPAISMSVRGSLPCFVDGVLNTTIPRSPFESLSTRESEGIAAPSSPALRVQTSHRSPFIVAQNDRHVSPAASMRETRCRQSSPH